MNGKVVSISAALPAGSFDARIDETIEVERGGWIAARAHGPKMLPYGATWWQMPVFAHTSPIYLDMPGRPAPARESARILLEQLGYLERWAESKANFPTIQNKNEALDLIRKAGAIYREREGAGRF